LGKIIGRQEVNEVGTKLIAAVVMETFDGCVLDRAVHALCLTVGPRVVRLGKSVLDSIPLQIMSKRIGLE
jgi:hypothetical protein